MFFSGWWRSRAFGKLETKELYQSETFDTEVSASQCSQPKLGQFSHFASVAQVGPKSPSLSRVSYQALFKVVIESLDQLLLTCKNGTNDKHGKERTPHIFTVAH